MVSGIHTGHAGSRLAGHHSRGAGTVRSTASVRAGTTSHARGPAPGAASARGAHSNSSFKGGRTAHASATADSQQPLPSTNTVAESRFVGCSKKVRDSESDIVEKIFFLLMGVFNPMSVSTCLFFFGLSGLTLTKVMPGLSQGSLLPAGVLGLILSVQMQKLLGMLAGKLESSALLSMEDAIGVLGEISVSIPSGRTGEVVFVLGQGKRNYSAKSNDGETAISRGAKVLIVDIEDNVVFVEPIDACLDDLNS